MKVLVAGFDEAATERLSVALRSAGHHVIGVNGRESCRALVRAVGPDRVLAPAGDGEVLVSEWLEGLEAVPPLVALAPGEAPEVALVPPTVGRAEPMRAEPEPPRRVVYAPEPEPEPPVWKRAHSEPAPVREPEPPPPASQPSMGSKLAQVRFGDYHSILETAAGASAWEIREQYLHLARLYSPAGWPGRLSPEDIDMLVEIGRGLRDAYSILGDPELRGRYERALTEASPDTLEPTLREPPGSR